MPRRGPGTVEITRRQARSVTLLLLVILASMWVAVLLPPYLRNRSSRSSTSLASFRRLVSTLERTGPDTTRPGWRGTLPPRFGGVSLIPLERGSAMMPLGRPEARRRRRDILLTLMGTAFITLALAVLLGGVAIWFHLLADALVATYIGLLVQVRRNAAERHAKVRYLPPRTATEPAALLVRRRA
jgi:hypothetical protein